MVLIFLKFKIWLKTLWTIWARQCRNWKGKGICSKMISIGKKRKLKGLQMTFKNYRPNWTIMDP